MKQINSTILNLIEALLNEEHLISDNRKSELLSLAKLCNKSILADNQLKLNVICTHNSRRSQLAQLWLRAAANYFNIDKVYTFSGGTEATAFNSRMVNALKTVGFQINQLDEFENPKYQIHLSENDTNMDLYFSKVYNESYNPQADYIAILVCNSAAEACPIVAGAAHRIALPYKDPKAFDDTEQEQEAYANTVREIGREMLFMMKNLNAAKV